MHELVDAGHMLVVIEHNLELISHADHLIDIGPVGGAEGGQILHQAPPTKLIEENASCPNGIQSKTIEALIDHMNKE